MNSEPPYVGCYYFNGLFAAGFPVGSSNINPA